MLQVGRYRLIAGIGTGGMADVYLAVYGSADVGRFQKLLVLKILKPELSADPEFVAMFLDEARLAARLNHPNVVQTIEVGEHAGRHFLAMEYLEGQPLNRVMQVLGGHSGFDLAGRLTVLLRALSGLDYAHELADYDGTPLSVVHRDVSPGNILVGYGGQIKLMDFGIAKANDSSSETRVGMFKGKTAYMAPEQARAGIVDRRADVYAAGVVLWELLVGRRMWQGLGQVEILSRVMAGDITPPSRLRPQLPAELERICMTALALQREERYPTAAAFAAELEDFVRRNLQPKPDREVGKMVADAFGGDRARIREIIEQQLSPRVRSSEPLPQMPAVSDPHTQSSVPDVSALISAPVSAPGSPSSASFTQTAHSTVVRSPASEPSMAAAGRGGRALRLGVAASMLAIASIAVTVALRSRATVEPPKPVKAAAASVPEAPSQQGVSPTEITLGMSAVFSGPNRQLGENMKLGLETAFWVANSEGGVHGRKLRLVALDDAYEAAKVGGTMQELLEQRKVFAVVGNVGTPTSVVAAPLASQHKTVFFGAFTGAPVLRQDPPDRYVFNYRASYREETAASIRYLVDVQKIPVEEIVVFAQEDSFGDAGFDGVSKAVRQLNHNAKDVLRVGYKRNTTEVDAAVAEVLKYHDKSDLVRQSQTGELIHVQRHPVKAVVMVATYRAAAKFIQKVRDASRIGKPFFFNVSFVGTEALADDLKGLDPRLCQGVYVTQVVPPFNSGATGVRRYRDALTSYQPQAQPGFVSLEGYIVGSVFAEALRRSGAQLTTEKLVDNLEKFSNVDLGFGTSLMYSLSEHQGSHKIWGTRLDEACACQTADLE
jgi:serine/threonine protein kinase/ABC-type branched-subunit amino acid transport system substrate-binding protein